MAAGGLCLAADADARKAAGKKAEVYEEWPFNADEAARRQEETAKALRIPKVQNVDLGGGAKITMILIPAGKYTMGDSPGFISRLILLALHVVAKQRVLVVNVEFAVGDDRMRPRWLARAVGLLETPAFKIFLAAWLDQHNRTLLSAIVNPARPPESLNPSSTVACQRRARSTELHLS
jgi:hypothetical protein